MYKIVADKTLKTNTSFFSFKFQHYDMRWARILDIFHLAFKSFSIYAPINAAGLPPGIRNV